MTEAESNAASSKGQRGPGHEAARTARRAVEAVLFSIADMPPAVDRAGIRDRLLRACEFLYASIDLPDIAVAHLQGLGEVAAIARECRGMLAYARDGAADGPVAQATARLAEVEAMLGRAYEEVARIQFDRRSELITGALAPVVVAARPFRASRGVPQLHASTRARLLPHILIGSDEAPSPPVTALSIPKPTTMEELVALGQAAAAGVLPEGPAGEPEPMAAEPEKPAPFAFEPAVEEVEVLRRVARDCLEDIANQRTLRVPNAIETWLDQAPFEQRLLDSLDAFAALGGSVLPLVSLFVAESDAPDPERAFAAAFTLSSLEGTDTMGAAVAMFKQSAPEAYPGWLDGFRLAPSSGIDAAMAELAGSKRPAWVAFALDVLGARGTVPEGVARPLLHEPDPAIAERLARALAASLPHVEAVPALEDLCALTQDDAVFLAAAESLLRRGHVPVLRTLRAVAAGRDVRPSPPAAGESAPPSASTARIEGARRLLCLGGTAADLELFLGTLRGNVAPGEGDQALATSGGRAEVTDGFVRALGRFGHAGALPALLGLLRADDEELVAAAAEGLDRITGAGLREIVEEPWEVDLPPEAEGHGIPVPTRKVEKVVVDPAQWTSWIAENGDRLDRTVKLRGGAPFVPLAIVEELGAKVTPPARRADAAQELAIVTGLSTSFATDDWVVRQQRALADLRERVAELKASPGVWRFGIDRSAGRAPSRSVLPAPPAGGAPAIRVPGAAPVSAAATPSAPPPPAVQRALPSFMRAAAVEAPSPGAPVAGGAATPPVPPATVEASLPLPAPMQTPSPGAAAEAHSQPPSPEPQTQDLVPVGTMVGVILPLMLKPAMPFGPKEPASAARPVGQPSPRVETPPRPPLPPSAARPAPFHAGKAPAEETLDDSTLEPGPSPIQPALPFQDRPPKPRMANPQPAAPAVELTLDQYTSMCAELAVFGDRAEAVFAKYGLTDVRRRAAVDAAWKERLNRYPSEKAEWERRYWQYESSWRRSRR